MHNSSRLGVVATCGAAIRAAALRKALTKAEMQAVNDILKCTHRTGSSEGNDRLLADGFNAGERDVESIACVLAGRSLADLAAEDGLYEGSELCGRLKRV